MSSLHRNIGVFLLVLLSFLTVECSKDKTDEIPENLIPTGRSKVYRMYPADSSDISGTATFVENEGGFITVNLNLKNTLAGGKHPAFMHRFTAAEGGGKALQLGTVDGNTGTSSSTFNKLNDGSKFTFEDLLQYNGYINVVLSESNQSTDISQGDIGLNELNGNSTTYDMVNDTEDVIGTVVFNERVNGTTLAVVGLENNPEAGDYPSHIHNGNSLTDGEVIISLKAVDGAKGFGQTQIGALDDGTSISFAELIALDGYIDVHESSGSNLKIIAKANIRMN